MDPNKISMPNNNEAIKDVNASHEFVRTLEQQQDFEKAIVDIIKSGYLKMQEHNDPDKKYHTTQGHLRPLYVRAPKMAESLGISLDKLRLARGVISWHDEIIAVKFPPAYNPEDPKTIVGMAARARGAREGDVSAGAEGNEAKSARELATEMRSKIGRDGKPIFTREEIETSILAVDVTYPGVDFGPDFSGAPFEGKEGDIPPNAELLKQNPALAAKISEIAEKGFKKGPKFFQPHLEKLLEEGKRVPEEVLIMAMTDLGGSGIANAEQFALEGDSEYWEVMPNIEKNLVGLASNPAMGVERGLVIDSMKNWLKSQVGFVTWQAIRFEKIVYLMKNKTKQLPEGMSEKETKLREVFGNYLKNIDAALARADRVGAEVERIKNEGLSDITDPEAKKAKEEENKIAAFKYIAKEMHYQV